ncbi:sodium channel regulatory subunit beta-3 isoform X1 [Panthera onca]|uniref:sodium channel subunit beta-3 isoform X1 n=2 Tax=Pantherinae TaxID=338153 RepID=UPI0029557000|nr:sodium channel subunit beta-3 isoform X1 [Panthera onca]XP_060461055.1 sodium channel subunit beta-3 isoform X1 [Panthera onca]XP_060461056.1 sodium channel subunit beta-3 isoform X1 [Panthera onca]
MSRLTEHTRSRRTRRRAVGHPPPRIGAPALSGGELLGSGPPSLPLPRDLRPTGAPASCPAPPDLLAEQRAGVDGTEVERILELRREAPVALGVGGTPSWRSRCRLMKPKLPGLGGSWSERSCSQGSPGSHPPEKRCLPSTDCFPWFPSCSSSGIYEYRNGQQEVESPFQGRLQWNGSKDLQDVSITVLNVTLNDSGLYTCNVSREFAFEAHRPFVKTTRLIPLRVTEEAGEDFTSVVSEIMMYILLVFLTLWLLVEMIYCYRKVSKAEEAAQENASDYLAIPSENKENSAVPVEE